mmetsp:Transcript_5687/g.14555  ORF Transcript_5687/g.14555 Transcript_5687/m.14555 type:complete len:317 (+) Transcript_5687:88-1038(+)
MLRLLHQLAHVVEHALLLLGLLLEVELRQGGLLLRRVHLVLLSDTDGVHPGVAAAAHDVAQVLVVLDLVRCHADLTTARDALPALHKRRHGLALARQQRLAVRVGGRLGLVRQLRPHKRVLLRRLDARLLRPVRLDAQLHQVRLQDGGLLLVQLSCRANKLFGLCRRNHLLCAEAFVLRRLAFRRRVGMATLHMRSRHRLFVRRGAALGGDGGRRRVVPDAVAILLHQLLPLHLAELLKVGGTDGLLDVSVQRGWVRLQADAVALDVSANPLLPAPVAARRSVPAVAAALMVRVSPAPVAVPAAVLAAVAAVAPPL